MASVGWTLLATLTVAFLVQTVYPEAIYVRLSGGDGKTTGRVEVSQNRSVWGTVCDDMWTEVEAQVVCNQLGFKWGIAYSNAAFGEGTGPIFLDNVQCTGTEVSMGSCLNNGWGMHNCRHYEDAGVACYNHTVRLRSRGRTNVGTVEMRYEDKWVEVCDQDWDDLDARVLCREMGFKSGKSKCCSVLGDFQSTSNKAFSHFKCNGNEAHLMNCSRNVILSKCSDDNRAAAICYEKPYMEVDMSFAIRLGNGSDPSRYWGEVNVRHEGIWGQVCSSGPDWNDNAARVVCKEMGFKGGVAYGAVNDTFMPIWVTKLNCTGSELSLADCVQEPWGVPLRGCKPAHALCYQKGVSVRLAGGGSYFGRVEVTHDGHTGTICDTAWSTSDARVVCKSLGFHDGDPVSGSYYGPGTGDVLMNGIGCYGYEKSVVQCKNKGWMAYKNTHCANHSNDASVICYKDVRLSKGDHSHGVVQIREENWSVVCGDGFTNTEARVVCRQLGFQDGMALAMGSFGTFYGKYVRPNISCDGTEKTITNCTYDEFRGCQKESFLGYAVVSCYNGTLSKAKRLKLEGGATEEIINQTGRVSIERYGIWGRVCPNSWDDNDATVVCVMLGYIGGVAYKYTSTGSGPYTMGKVSCVGTEKSLFDCPVSSEFCDAQFSSGDAGVLCYTNRKPALRLIGSHNAGRLEVLMDSSAGAICDFGWSRYDASVACKQLGFMDGEPRGFPSAGSNSVVMASMGCFGGEDSIFMCRNPGWKKNVDDRCFEANRNAGVFCYNNVRINGGRNNENITGGKVEMYYHGNWVTMCATGFDSKDAHVVCRELGYPNSKALVPGAFGRKFYTEFVSGFNCTGSELTIADCPYETEGFCGDRSSNYASVLCSKFPIDDAHIKVLPFEKFPSTVIVEKHGMNGTVCAEDWDNTDARVLCTQLNYTGGGVAFGPQYSSSSTPIWMTGVRCNGTEGKIQQCQYEETPTSECLSNQRAAMVYCYEGPGFAIRLAGSKSPSSGRVEISYGGKWGTICDSYWSDKDARVVCRQLGFLDGVSQPNSFFGPGTGNAWLYYVRCDGEENAIWSCTNSGFNVTHTSCRNHQYDASVYCTDRVRLKPNVTFGAVQLWADDDYKLVCADDFDDLAAKVVCKSLGYKNGISICCSAFGDMGMDIGYSQFKCTGNEDSIFSCPHSTEESACLSKKYAAVACSNLPGSGEYGLKLDESYRGSVQVRHFDIWGHVCSNGFDDNDAMVVCRQLGYTGGFSYYRYRYRSKFTEIPWLSNMNCSGQESYIGRCGNIRWGEVEGCTMDIDAAAYCYNKEGARFRLANGTSPLSGRVEMSIDGEWGTVCGTSTFNDNAANVLCRQLGFTGGRALEKGHFGEGTGKIMVPFLRCIGSEDSLLHCPIKIQPKNPVFSSQQYIMKSTYFSCGMHSQDAAVQCYESGYKFRLANGTNSLSGRVELSIDGVWGTVCGQGFFDDSAANVVCRQMNYTGGRSLRMGQFGSGSGKIYITMLRCVGNESSLMHCPMKIESNTAVYPSRRMTPRYMYIHSSCFSHSDDAAVQCYESVRLVGTNDLNYGILEMNVDNTWHAVCDAGFSDAAAKVVCMQLGYKDGRFQIQSALGELVDEKINITNLACRGTEKSLKECQYRSGSCSTGHYVTVYCNKSSIIDTKKLEVRVSGGKSYYGSLEINKYGFWGPVCSYGWDDTSAKAACRQLGYVGGVAYNGTSRLDTPMAVGMFDCKGAQNRNLSECKYKGFSEYLGCNYKIKGVFKRPTAGVLCYNSADGVKFRIAGSSKHQGRVEVMFNGKWGRVCNSSWQQSAAKVFCRQLGFVDGKTDKFPERNKGHVWMNYVNCEGTESSILTCSNTWNPSANCDDAGVICYDTVRLAHSKGVSYGAVEVNVNKMWGVVCNKNWTQTDTNVVCTQLGYETGIPLCCAPFGYTTSQGFAEKVQCTGNESRLTDCDHDVPYGHMCSLDYAAVACYDGALKKNAVVSISGREASVGSVGLDFMGISGRICSDDWDDNDAKVVCKSIGFQNGESYRHYKWSTGRGENAPFWTSQVNCTGNERSLNECAKVEYGKVKECINKHFAGAICYQNHGTYFRLSGGGDTWGRVEVSVDGTWGTLCNRYWDINDATVLCRSLNFVAGFPLYRGKFGDAPKVVYEPNLHCNGSESSLRECPHEGWKPTKGNQPCADHSKDAAVQCYTSVKLGSGTGHDITHGHLLYYKEETRVWNAVCDEDFDDNSATVVCRELGFKLGKAICCSAYGKIHEDIMVNKTLSCTGNEASVNDCLTESAESCDSYASVACFNELTLDDEYSFSIKNIGTGPYTGIVEVKRYGMTGRICSKGWDDSDAQVLCRSKEYNSGIAYNHADNEFAPLLGRGPYSMGNVSCTGTEQSLLNCSFGDRLHLGTCTKSSSAAVLCYNTSGLEFRIVNDDDHGEKAYGRVELSVGKQWGTVCDASWDDADATVMCRQMSYHGGYGLRGAKYGPGSGPIWLSHLHCDGTEPSLHKCTHRGFNSAVVDGSVGWWKCRSHDDDASVYCFNNLKLSQGFNATMGAVLLYHSNQWHGVCDSDFDYSDARVVCKTLGFADGKAVLGSAFGDIRAPIGISSIACLGDESNIINCPMADSPECDTGTYASVFCSKTQLGDQSFGVRIVPDNAKSKEKNYGFLEVHINDVWGSVCTENWDDNAASVACRQLGFSGGAAYRPPKNISSAFRLDKVQCTGSEENLLKCKHNIWKVNHSCDYYSNRAGVFCYKDAGLEFRLGGGEGTRGRVEMKYNGVWGGICDWLWDSRDAKVFCNKLNYKDGLEIVGARYGHLDGPLWFTRVSCDGNESSVLTCRHTGFNSSDKMEGVYGGLCRTRSHDAAAECFTRTLEITNVRLVNMRQEVGYGRVEVFLSGPDQWGTVCDDFWDKRDATVVCKQLGFSKGVAVKGAKFGRGQGAIWLDNLRCVGNESRIQDCRHNGFSVQNCNHGEDAGVFCSGTYVPVTTTAKPDHNVGPDSVGTGAPPISAPSQHEGEDNVTVYVAVTVPIILILLAIIIVFGVIYYRRSRPKGEIKKVLVNNDMNDPNAASTSTPSSDGRVTLSKLKAHFSKPKHAANGSNGESTSQGISNPIYDQDKNRGDVVMEEITIEQPTIGQSEL